MAKNKRICNGCKKQIKRGDRWRMVATTFFERLGHWLLWHKPLIRKSPQHWDCERPTAESQK